MKSYVTTFYRLFTDRPEGMPAIERIEIPIIQRDYAQGRADAPTRRVRCDFLKVLSQALSENLPVNLDFIYGEVRAGVFQPFDGQQRLTTLFLLHWYLASRSDQLDQDHPCWNFEYATRPSTRSFCNALRYNRLVLGEGSVENWIVDQPWYLYTWMHDPSVRSMLTMLDAIHKIFEHVDPGMAWDRLISDNQPAVSFHLLPLGESSDNSELYIKMNSRGKPLTAYENFKARLEQILNWAPTEAREEFSRELDTYWSDVFWSLRGDDDLIDDELRSYIDYITEVICWKGSSWPDGELIDTASKIYGRFNPKKEDNFSCLRRSFEIWVDTKAASFFEEIFKTNNRDTSAADDSRVTLFGLSSCHLLAECCKNYRRSENRAFSFANSLLLYASIVHLSQKTNDFQTRARILRNLLEASSSEVRLDRMPALVADVERLVSTRNLDEDLKELKSFNSAQVDDEIKKLSSISSWPQINTSLRKLENHDLLRGCLYAFELPPDIDHHTFNRRTDTFCELFSEKSLWGHLTAALLCFGDYSRHSKNSFQFGTGSTDNANAWRSVFTGTSRSALANTRSALAGLLDHMTVAGANTTDELERIRGRYLASISPDVGYDWRWYFLKYPVMRDGKSGIYVAADGQMAFSICMLKKVRLSGYYRDPYLSALHELSQVGDAVDPLDKFYGYETIPRRMRLKNSGVTIRCVKEGYELESPLDMSYSAAFVAVAAKYKLNAEHCLRILKSDHFGDNDAEDRVARGAALLRDLVDAGL